MPRKEVFNLTIDVGANISQAQSAAKSLQQAFSRVNLTEGIKKGLDKTFGDLEKELNNFASMTSKPFTDMKDIQKAEKSFEKINDLLNELQVQGKTIAGMDLSKFLPNDTVNKLKSFNDQLKQVRQSQENLSRQKLDLTKQYDDYNKRINDVKNELQTLKDIEDNRQKTGKGLTQSQQDQVIRYTNELKKLESEQEEVNKKITDLNKIKPEGLQRLRESLKEFSGASSLREIPTNLDNIQKYIDNLSDEEIKKVAVAMGAVKDESENLSRGQYIQEITRQLNDCGDQGRELNEVAKEVERLGEQVKQFFSIGNTIQLFKRAVRDAMATVKELDATMTETATVTDFSISDMWEQLPRYTDEANKLGTSINSLYKATTLYYQQGLDTNEAMALGIETIKMARVANMDAALATDLMTAALRGFNMELNEMSAVRINDVYSELAAVTAADTDEIGIAISKTASIAHSANMEFETTAAFLSQIIETTREAPETAGTAMKTIIARFSEVKKLYSEGQILGTDEEGEAINVNKIQEALRTVGIDMTKFFVGAEGLDDVLLRLAQKWDTLDVATQRYIATQAAGSRQQSRFLAMMSDYDRTMELVNAAYDSAGSGQAQFEKTLDSMQAKLAELKNAWDQFVMGLANNEILKTGVDILTGILSTINDIISAVSGNNGLVKSILSLGSAFLALRGGAKIFGGKDGKVGLLDKIIGTIKGTNTENKIKKNSLQIGQSIGKAIGKGIEGTGNIVQKSINKIISSKDNGFWKSLKTDISNLFNGNNIGKDYSQVTEEQYKAAYDKLSKGQKSHATSLINKGQREEAIKYIEQQKIAVEGVIDKEQAWAESSQKVGNAISGVGIALTTVGGLISQQNEELGNTISTLGLIITSVGGIISMFPAIKAGIDSITASMAANPVGATITAIVIGITTLVTLFNALSNSSEKALKKAEEKAKKSAEAAREAQQAYDDLLSNRNNYNELENKVKSLTEGTREWTEAVRELNTAVLELTQKYEGLEIVVDGAGNISITDESWNKVQEQQRKKLQEKQFTAAKDAIDREQKRVKNARENTKIIDGSGKAVTDIQTKENGEIDEEWVKSQNYNWAETVDLTEAEKSLERERKNLITWFAADIIKNKEEANQISSAMSKILGEAIDNIQTPEEMQGKIKQFQEEFGKLSNKAKGLFSGEVIFGNAIDDYKDFGISEEFYKENTDAIDKLIEENKNNVEKVQTELGRVGLSLDEVGTKDAKAFIDKTSKMSIGSAKAFYKAWDDIRQKNPNLGSNLLNFEANNINDLTSIVKMMREAGVEAEKIEEYWKAATVGVENYGTKLGDVLNRGDALRDSIKSINELIERADSGALTQEDVERILGAGFDISNLQQTAEGWQLIGVSIEEVRRALNGDLAEEEAITTDIIKEQILETQKELDKLANISNNDPAAIARREYLTNQLSELEKSYTVAEKNEAFAQASKYTAQENEVRGGSEESIVYSAQNEAQRAGYDTEELDAYALSLQNINQNLQNNKATAYEVALSNMNLNAGLDEIIGSYNDWVGLIDQDSGLIKATTSDDAKAYNDLRDSVNKMLNASEDLSDEFWNNAKNIENIKKAAEGDTEALGELQVAAAQDYLINLGLDPEAQNIVNDFANELENWELPTLEAGVELTGQDDFIAACQEMINASGMTADQVSEYFKRLGYDVEFDGHTTPITQTRYYPQTSYSIKRDDEGNITDMIPSTDMVPVTWTEDVMAPSIKTLTSTGSGGGGISTKNLTGGKGNASKGKKGGGGGGGSSKKQDNWKNPYDKYYNLTEKINEALRTREKIERDYDRILKRRERTAAELLKNSAQEIANLRQEVEYQKRLQAGRREQIENLANERYDNGDQRTTFEKMGVTKYANYNFDTQTIQIDWAAIEAVRDEELGKAIEAYVGRLEELQGQFEDTQTTIEDMEDTIWEINQRGKEEYLSFEQRIIDALINADQKLIDDLSAKFDSINEANSRVLSSMQESIDLERQIRDNTKTEDDIASKEASLAYLRRDTSGANQMEIMKLEQDLADARQNYSDQLIDQGMQKLSDENEKASQQRQEQIDIMQAIHDWTVQSGGFNATAERLINETAAAGEVTEEVKKLLQDNEGWTSMTKFAGEDWMTKLANEYKAAMEGMSNFKVDQEKLKHTSSNNTMSVQDEHDVNKTADVWFDNTLQRWIDKSGNLYDIYWDATANKGSGAYVYSNKQAKDTTDPNAWLKDYLASIQKALDGKASSTSGSNTGGNSGNSGNSGSGNKTSAPKKYYRAQIKDGPNTLWTGSTKHSSTSAAEKEAKEYLGKMRQDKYNAWKNASSSEKEIFRQILAQWNRANASYKTYKTGGLSTQTGLAWLDGTASHPELVLNARDTENFIQLKDILSDMGSLDKLQNGGDNYYNFDIKVDQLANDYDVDKLIGKIKNEINKDATYRNVNAINLIR